VDDPLPGWIQLQRDLGGDEVYFDTPLKPDRDTKRVTRDKSDQHHRKVPATVTGHVSPVTAAAPVPSSFRFPTYAEGSEPAWLKGAPPVPGFGLDVASPPPGIADPVWRSLDEIAEVVRSCTKCPLCRGRTHAVPGEGDPSAGLFVVGEGPGEQEDLTGRPFVGRAGELLDKILASVDVARSAAHIANVVKCRPPRNRAPLPDERAACLPYLYQQIGLVRPKVLLALGATAAEALLGVKKPLGELRLKVHRFNGIPLVVSYHPAALLRNPNWKRPAWDDVRIARQLLDRLD
jgi:uracil-DNA glycosylase family 4